MLLFRPMKNSLPRFSRPAKIEVTGELAQRLERFQPTLIFENFAEVDGSKNQILLYQRETAFRKYDPIVFQLEEFCHYRIWEDGSECLRENMGYAYAGDLLPGGKIQGGKNSRPGQRMRRQYVFKRHLLLDFQYLEFQVTVCLDVISLRTQTESLGYREIEKKLNHFLDFLDAVQAGIPLFENTKKEAVP